MLPEEMTLASVSNRLMCEIFKGLAVVALALATAPSSYADSIYVVNEADQTLSVIDSSKNTVVATIPVNDSVHSMVMARDSSKLYISTTNGNIIRILNTQTNSFTGSISLPDGPSALAVSPDGGSLYASSMSGNVYIISTESEALSGTVSNALYPGAEQSAAVSSDGSLLFVAVGGIRPLTVQFLNTATRVAGAVPGPGNCYAVVANPKSDLAYVGCSGGTIYAVDSTRNFSTTPILAGSQASSGAMTPDGQTLYFTTESSGILAIDPTTFSIKQTIPDAGFPWGVAITADGKHAYVPNILTDTVTIIDTSTNAIVGSIPVGISPDIAVSGLVTVSFAKYTPELLVAPKLSAYSVAASFTLGSSAPALSPTTQSLTLTIGSFSATIPSGSIKRPNAKVGLYTYDGVVNGKKFGLVLTGNGSGPWGILVVGTNAFGTLAASVPVSLTIGQSSGKANVRPLVVNAVQSLN